MAMVPTLFFVGVSSGLINSCQSAWRSWQRGPAYGQGALFVRCVTLLGGSKESQDDGQG